MRLGQSIDYPAAYQRSGTVSASPLKAFLNQHAAPVALTARASFGKPPKKWHDD